MSAQPPVVRIMYDAAANEHLLQVVGYDGAPQRVAKIPDVHRNSLMVVIDACTRAHFTPPELYAACVTFLGAASAMIAGEIAEQQRAAEQRSLVDLLVGTQGAVAIPSFAAIAQPAFRWKETAHLDGSGATEIPKPGDEDKIATIVYPFGDTPWARAVKIHELLHARFTPEIMSATIGTKYEDIVHQIAEDIRLSHIAHVRGLYHDDTFFPEAAWNLKPEQPRSDLDKAIVMMSNWGQPLEGTWDKSDISEYMTRLGGVTSETHSILESWKSEIQRILSEAATASEQFSDLANVTHNTLVELTEPPPPSGGEGSSEEQDGSDNQKDPTGGGGDNGDGHSQEPSEDESEKHKDTKDDARPSAPQDKNEQEEPSQNQSREAQRRRKAAQKQHAKRQQRARREREEKARTLTPSARAELCKSATRAAQSLGKTLAPSLQQEVMDRIKRAMRENTGTNEAEDVRGYGNTNTPWTPGGLRPPPPTEETALNYSLDVTENIWGEMTVQLAPLQRNFKALVKRPGAAAPEGPSPRHLHRWFGDKQLFVRQGLRRGGTLLIDISGSMGWAWNDTLALIEATPAMTIALYSGLEDCGHLTIIAKDGRLVAKDFNPASMGHGGGNTVDGPALAWLARQPRPRVWFSDGQVHGSRTKTHQYLQRTGRSSVRPVLSADVQRLTRLGAIHRTVEVDAIKKIFMGMKVLSKQE